MEYDKIELIENKAEKLLDKFLSDSDVAVYTNALYFLISIFLIVVCLLYVFEGYEHLVYIISLLAIIPYRMIIASAAQNASSKSLQNKLHLTDKTELTVAKLDYLAALVALKSARLRALRLFYCICFPVWLYMLAKLFVSRPFEGIYELYLIIPALIIGVSFWYYYFQKDIEAYKEDLEEISGIQAGIVS